VKHAQEPKPPGEVVTPPPPTPGEDVNFRLILRFVLSLAFATLAVGGLLLLLMKYFAGMQARADRPPAALAAGPWERLTDEQGSLRLPEGGVALQRQPFRDIEALAREESEQLDALGWVDARAGIVHIPIEEAMRLLVRRGVPARSADGATPTATEPPEAPRPTPTAIVRRVRPQPVRPAASPAEAPATETTPEEGEAVP
jgi:hypothetical protein